MTSTGTLASISIPYPDDDLDYDDDEEMETDYQNAPPGGTGDTRVATPASAGRRYYCPLATYSMQTFQGQTSGSLRSTHTDTDMAMEMGGLSMAPGGPDTHHVPPRVKAPDRPGIYVNPGIGRHGCLWGRSSRNTDIGTVRPASK